MSGLPRRDDVKEKKNKMNMKKALPLLVIASMMASLMGSVVINAALTNTLNVSSGPVGTVVTVSGTLNTFNGRYIVQIDADNNNVFGNIAIENLAGFATTLSASGYSYSVDVTIPDAYAGARKIRVTDLDAAGVPTPFQDAFFTVTTKWALKLTAPASGYTFEGGLVTVTATLTGGDAVWDNIIDLQYRFKNPTGTVVAPLTTLVSNIAAVAATPGKVVQAISLPLASVNLVLEGVWTALVDWDTVAAFPSAQQGVASTTFTIRATDKLDYDRTQTALWQIYITAGTYDKFTVTDPAGVITTTDPINVGSPSFINGVALVSGKTTTLGVYTLKVYDILGAVIKSQTFNLNKATISPVYTVFTDTSTQPDGAVGNLLAAADNVAVKRMHKITIDMTVKYPDLTDALPADITGGFDVKAYYNSTLVATVHLDPLTASIGGAPNLWEFTWLIPKDAVVGKNWVFNVTANGIADTYGNSGPSKNYGSKDVNKDLIADHRITVAKGTIFVTAAPTLNYPGAAANLQRTLEAKATVDARYADNSRVTGSDISQFNVTASTSVIQMVAADYNGDVGLWIPKWTVPYKAPIGAASFGVATNACVDKYGNKGPTAPTLPSAAFNIVAATISVSGVTVDKSSVQSDEQITASFSATYPSGAPVATKNTTGPFVTFYDNSGVNLGSKRASYSVATQKWSASFIVPAGSTSGSYNATVNVNNVHDDAAVQNAGPTAKKYTNFDVSRVSMTDVLAASDAAKVASDAAKVAADASGVKADAAKLAADTAKTAADAAKTAATQASTDAKAATTAATAAGTAATAAGTAATAAKTSADAATTAATSAGTKADAAKTAADGAKAAADNAAAAANGLTTLVYAAIGASLIAALAAIVALMQISRKIA